MPDIFIFAGHYVISESERCQILQYRLYPSRQLGEPFSSCSSLQQLALFPHTEIVTLFISWGVFANTEAVTLQHPASLINTDLLMVFKSWRCHLTSSWSPDSAAGVVASHRDTHPAISSAAPRLLVLLLTWRGRWGIAPSAGSRQQISICRRSASKRRQWFTATGFVVLPLFCVFLFFFVEFNLCPPPPCKEGDKIWWGKVKNTARFLASATVFFRHLLFCDVTQRMLVVVYRRFGTVYESPLQGSSCPGRILDNMSIYYYIREGVDGAFSRGGRVSQVGGVCSGYQGVGVRNERHQSKVGQMKK